MEWRRRGQNVVEYMLLIAVLVAAILTVLALFKEDVEYAFKLGPANKIEEQSGLLGKHIGKNN